jgi:hypothetical protein
MKKLIVFLFIISSLSGLSQEINLPKDALKSNEGEFLVLKDGTYIECTKIKVPGPLAEYYAKVKYTTIDDKKGDIDKGDIEAILNLTNGEISYSRKFTFRDYTLLPRIQEGGVKIYEEITYSRSGTPGTVGGSTNSNTNYFIEKGNKISSISGRGIFVNSKNQKETLLAFLGDNAAIKKEIENPDYKNKWINIRKAINKYNLHHFDSIKKNNKKPEDFTQTVDLIKMNFYTNKKLIEGSYLLDENGNKYKLSKQIAATILLPRFKESKICLVVDGIQYCDIVMAISEKNSFYEVILDEGFLHCVRGLR